MGASENKGPYNKDPTISGTILGSPISGNPHISPSVPYDRYPKMR